VEAQESCSVMNEVTSALEVFYPALSVAIETLEQQNKPTVSVYEVNVQLSVEQLQQTFSYCSASGWIMGTGNCYVVL
jgi:hypothetical protein